MNCERSGSIFLVIYFGPLEYYSFHPISDCMLILLKLLRSHLLSNLKKYFFVYYVKAVGVGKTRIGRNDRGRVGTVNCAIEMTELIECQGTKVRTF